VFGGSVTFLSATQRNGSDGGAMRNRQIAPATFQTLSSLFVLRHSQNLSLLFTQPYF